MPKALAEATPEALAELVPADIAKRIARKFNHATEPKRNQKLAKEVQTAVASMTIQKKITDAILVLDRQHPGTIEFQGKGVKLTSKQFWLLTALAESPGKCVSYDALYNKVWGDEVSVELQQLSYHKSQLLKKMQPRRTEIECKNVDHAGLRRRHGFESSSGRNRHRTSIGPHHRISESSELV